MEIDDSLASQEIIRILMIAMTCQKSFPERFCGF
jgi:hypothetical protein